MNSAPATPEDASSWAEQYNVTYPFLIDPDNSFDDRFEQDNYIPSFFIIEPGLNMVVVDDATAANQIGQYLP